MIENEFADGDGDEPELEAEFIPSENDICTWTNDPDEKRRAFVANLIAGPDIIEAGKLIENMHAICEWLKTGRSPKSHLKVVGSNDASITKNKGGI